jgi:AraC-like DNA-binding protein
MEEKEAYNNYRIEVPAAFEELFSYFYFAENKSDDAITRTLMPSFQTIMVFSFGTAVSFLTREQDEVTISKCLVVGPIKQAISYTLPAGAEILVVNFKDDAFFRFFGTAVVTAHLHPDDLLNADCFTTLWTELRKISTVSGKVDHILDFCRPYIRNSHPVTAQIIALGDSGISPVKEISDRENLSERSVQMNLKKHFGYSFREISRYMRFLKAVQLVQQIASGTDQMDWFEVIDVCGYYDQSQLIHDFKYYMDLSPSKYLKFQQGVCSSRF